MFGLGATEILFLLVIALVVLGPKNLPKAARTLGRLFGQVQRMSSEISSAVRMESWEAERRERERSSADVVSATTEPEQDEADLASLPYDELKATDQEDADGPVILNDKPGPPSPAVFDLPKETPSDPDEEERKGE